MIKENKATQLLCPIKFMGRAINPQSEDAHCSGSKCMAFHIMGYDVSHHGKVEFHPFEKPDDGLVVGIRGRCTFMNQPNNMFQYEGTIK